MSVSVFGVMWDAAVYTTIVPHGGQLRGNIKKATGANASVFRFDPPGGSG